MHAGTWGRKHGRNRHCLSQSEQEVQRYLPQTTSLQMSLSYCICANAQSSGVRAHTEKKKFCLLVLNSVCLCNLSTAVDTSAAAACNAWCVCFFLLFLEASHPADVPAPVFSGTSAFSLRLMPSRLTPGATSALQSPPRFHLCPSSPFGHVRFESPLHPGFFYTHLM
jgi:hypothetical protein